MKKTSLYLTSNSFIKDADLAGNDDYLMKIKWKQTNTSFLEDTKKFEASIKKYFQYLEEHGNGLHVENRKTTTYQNLFLRTKEKIGEMKELIYLLEKAKDFK